MDINLDAIIEVAFVPWWKGIAWLLAIAVTVVSVRIGFTFDLNVWLTARQARTNAKRLAKNAQQCKHVWIRYPYSPFAICGKCRSGIECLVLDMYAADPNVVVVEAERNQRNFVRTDYNVQVPTPYNNVVHPPEEGD